MKITAKFIGTNNPSISNMVYVHGNVYNLIVDTVTLSGSFTVGNINNAETPGEYLDSRCEYGSLKSFTRNWEIYNFEKRDSTLSRNESLAYSQVYHSFISYLRDRKLESILT